MEDGSLYAVLRALRTMATSRFARRASAAPLVAAPKWAWLQALGAWLATTARALSLCVVPMLSCAVGNLLLFSGQGREFLREYASFAYRAQVDFRSLADPRIAWMLGLSIWAVATWYVARQLLSRLYVGAGGANAPGITRWEGFLRTYLPRLLGLLCLLPHGIVYPVLIDPAMQMSSFVWIHAALLAGSILIIEALLNGARAPQRFNLVVGVLGVALVGGALIVIGARSGWGGALFFLGQLALVSSIGVLLVREPWKRPDRWLLVASALLFVVAIVVQIVWWLKFRAVHDWQPLAALMLPLLFYCFVGWRRDLVLNGIVRGNPPAHASVPVKQIAPVHLKIMIGSVVASFGMAAAIYLFPVWLPRAIGAVSLTLLAVAFIAMLFGLVLVLLPRTYGLPSLVIPVLVSALLVGYWTPYRSIADLEPHGPASERDRPELAPHFAEWQRRRQAAEDTPVFVVAAEGGGARAAVWTAFALARLEDATCGQFHRHVYAISSVSGGSLGAAYYVASLAEHGTQVVANRSGCWLQGSSLSFDAVAFFRRDFISPVLAAYLFGDLLRQFPVFNLVPGGRGRVLEQTWEQDWRDIWSERSIPQDWINRFEQPFLDLYRGDALYELPLLFLNGTTVEDGKRAIAAPVRARHTDAFDLFNDRLVTHGLRLSTAVHNSARFPFVSPAGFIEQLSPAGVDARDGGTPLGELERTAWGRVVDGGYFENSGAATALEIVEQIATAQGGRRDNIHVLVLSNAPRNATERLCAEILEEGEGDEPAALCRTDAVKAAAARNAWMPDLSAPVDALMNTREARGSFAKTALAQAIGDPARVHELFLARWRGAHIDPPLGWFMSQESLTAIDRALSPQDPIAADGQPARRTLQAIAWKLVDPDARISRSDLAEDIEYKRNQFFCRRAGLKDCSDPTLPGGGRSL